MERDFHGEGISSLFFFFFCEKGPGMDEGRKEAGRGAELEKAFPRGNHSKVLLCSLGM